MKKEIIIEDQCPYCKRHCLLSNPHCKKGKTLAEEKKKEAKKSKMELTTKSLETMKEEKTESVSTEAGTGGTVDSYIEDWRRAQAEIKLLHLFQDCYHLLSSKKGSKQGNKMRKFYILSILEDKGELTQKELEDHSKLSSADLTEHLLKMKKKGYINLMQEDGKGMMVTLTESGLESAKAHIKERSQDRFDIFSVLDDEEKAYLENILKKLYTEWNHESDKE